MKFVPCQDMSDVRANIDRVDRMLVHLLAERQCYIDEAARIKADRNVVRDNQRVEDVISKVKAAAERDGLDPEVAETLWRTLIECSIQREFVKWDEIHSGDEAPS